MKSQKENLVWNRYLKIKYIQKMSTENKLVKTLMEASTLIAISTGAGYIVGKKLLKNR